MIFLTNRFYLCLNSFHQKTFKLLALLITATFLSINATAQVFIPDDFYPNDAPNGSRLLYSNQGQLLKTDGTLASNIDYYNIGSTPNMYLSHDAVSITSKKLSDMEGTPDTVIRVDITPLNGQFRGGFAVN